MQRTFEVKTYDRMLNDEGLVDKMMSYLMLVEKAHGAQIFIDCLANKQDGRLFGNLTSSNPPAKTKLSDFYPEQKQLTADGQEKIFQVDVLGERISAAIVDDINSGTRFGDIGAALAEALNRKPEFQQLLTRITESTGANDETKEKVKNFILGQFVFFSLLPVFESGIKKLNDEVISPEMEKQKLCRRAIQAERGKEKPDEVLIQKLNQQIMDADERMAPSAKIMRDLTIKMGKMKTTFSTAGSYNHEKSIFQAKTKEGDIATVGKGLAQHWGGESLDMPKKAKSADPSKKQSVGARMMQKLGGKKSQSGPNLSASDRIKATSEVVMPKAAVKKSPEEPKVEKSKDEGYQPPRPGGGGGSNK